MDTHSNAGVAELKSDFRMLLIQNLEHLKNEILNNKWAFEAFDLGGKKYKGKDARQYSGKKYPRTALKILQSIESILAGEQDLVFGIARIAKDIDASRTSKRYEIYKDYKTILNNMSLFVLQMIMEQIQALIKEVKTNKNFNHHVGTLENIYKRLDESIKKGSSPITALITLQNDISRGSLLQEEKFIKFFRKKIFPFITKLEELEEIDKKIKISEATTDLNTLIVAMIKFKSDPKSLEVLCRVNAFNEIVVRVGLKDYNLTQILRHEPDFSKLVLSNELLDQYFRYLQNDEEKILMPAFNNNTNMNKMNWRNQTPYVFKTEIEAIHQSKHRTNNFTECHAAHILAMNIYTGPAYSVMNSLLRNKGVSSELFSGDISKEMTIVKENMRQAQSLANPDHMQPVEMNKLIQEIMLAVAVAAQGIEKSKHGEAEPQIPVKMINDMLLPQQSKTVRGAGGDWAEQKKDSYRIAYEAGLPLYASEFASTSFNPNVARKFTDTVSDKFITKHVPLDVMKQGGIGVDVSMISVFENEAEYLYPPGCLVLPTPESDVKRKEHYAPGLDKKLSVVMTKGISEKSFAYSSEIQAYRNALIALYEEIKIQKFPVPLNKKQNFILQELENNIKKLSTNFKTANLYFLNEMPTDMKDPLFADSDVSFVLSKGYDLCLMSETEPKKGELHVRCHSEGLEYKVFGLMEIQTISWDKLPKDFPRQFTGIDEISKFLPDILEFTSKNGHTLPKSGQLHFIDPINNQQIIVQLSIPDQNKLIDILKLNEEGGAKQNNISYEKVHLLEKWIGEKLILRHDANVMISNMSDEITKLREDYVALKHKYDTEYYHPSTPKLYQKLGVTHHETQPSQTQVQQSNANTNTKEKSTTHVNQPEKEKEKEQSTVTVKQKQTGKDKEEPKITNSDRFHF